MNEEMLKGIKFDEKGLVPVVVQDVDTHVVLMLAYMNREALEQNAGNRADVLLQPQPPVPLGQGGDFGPCAADGHPIL